MKLRLIMGLTAALRAAAKAGRERNMAASIELVFDWKHRKIVRLKNPDPKLAELH